MQKAFESTVAISFLKYFKVLLEISPISELDFSFKSLIIDKVASAIICLKHHLKFGLFFKYCVYSSVPSSLFPILSPILTKKVIKLIGYF